MDITYVGKKVLITTNNWFYAPNGECYRAVYGTLRSIKPTKESIGLDPQRSHANWVAIVGNMTIAGCQVHYAIQTDNVNLRDANTFEVKDGELKITKRPSTIYDADGNFEEKVEVPEEKRFYEARPYWCTLSRQLKCDNTSFCFGDICQHDGRKHHERSKEI